MKKILFIILGLIFVLGLPALALAQQQENYNLPADETFEGNLFFAGNTITIDGQVRGDVAVAGNEININGKITGTLVAAGSNITLGEKADISGNAFIGASNVTINGKIAKNTYLGCSNLTIGEKGELGQDLYAGSSVVVINGKIGRDLFAGTSTTTISGKIGRKTSLELETLTINKEAEMEGDVVYRSEKDAQISDEAKITGSVEKKKPRFQEKKENKQAAVASYITGKLYRLLMILLVALVLVFLAPRTTRTISESITKNFWTNLLAGIIVFVITPILAALLLITIIGIPISIFLVFVYIVVLYISKIFVGTIAGIYLIERAWPKMEEKKKFVWSVLLGTLIIFVLICIPFIGGIIGFLSTLLVMGALWAERKIIFGNR